MSGQVITDPSLAIAEAIRTGKPVEVRRADGSVRVVVSIPGEDLACPICDETTKCAASDALAKRRDELLALVASISQTVPLESEVSEALAQRGALLAEVGTLRDEVARLTETAERERLHAKMFARAADTEKSECKVWRDKLAASEKERDELRAALRWALDDIAEAWPYAGDYFQDKWRDVTRENELRTLVGMEPIAKGTNRE